MNTGYPGEIWSSLSETKYGRSCEEFLYRQASKLILGKFFWMSEMCLEKLTLRQSPWFMKEVTALARPIEHTKLGLRNIVLNKTNSCFYNLLNHHNQCKSDHVKISPIAEGDSWYWLGSAPQPSFGSMHWTRINSILCGIWSNLKKINYFLFILSCVSLLN